MELRRYISLILGWWWLLALVVLLGIGMGWLLSILTVPVYSASTTIQLSQSSLLTSPVISISELTLNERLAKTYAQTMRSRAMMERVIQKLDLNIGPGALAGQVTIAPVRETQLLNVTVEDTVPQRVADIANAVVSEFSAQTEEMQATRYAQSRQSLEAELVTVQQGIAQTQEALDALAGSTEPAAVADRARLQELLTHSHSVAAGLVSRLEDIRVAVAQSMESLIVVDEAVAGGSPVRPRPTINMLLGGLIGLALALAFVFVKDHLDDTVKSTDEIEQLVDLSALGAISVIHGSNEGDKLITLSKTHNPVAEAYRVLAANIQFVEVDDPIRTLLITSGSPGEGKTTTAANLAVVMAQMGRRVVVVDADLRRPTLHKYFETASNVGLTTALLQHDTPITDHLLKTSNENLMLMPSGPLPPNPAELMSSQRMHEIVDQLKAICEVVVFDTPPALVVADATLLSRACDATVLVIRARGTRAEAVVKAYSQLRQAGTRVVGFVLNRMTYRAAGYSYNYYYYSTNTPPKSPSRRGLSLPLLQSRNGHNTNGHSHAVDVPPAQAKTDEPVTGS